MHSTVLTWKRLQEWYCNSSQACSIATTLMAPRLAASQHQLISDMILDGTLKQTDIAKVGGCSERSVRAIASNLRHFGTTRAPPNGTGPRRRITPLMINALREHLRVKPRLYLDEMSVFLYNKFGILYSTLGISRALKSIGWSKKAT